MTVVLKASNLKKSYTSSAGMFGKKRTCKALDDVSLSVEKGKTLAIVGESGCGKSTLARQLTLIERPDFGEVEILGQKTCSLTNDDRKILRKKIQIVFQNPFSSLNPRKKIFDILNEPLVINTDMSAVEREKHIYETLERVGMRSFHAQRYPHMFSGGQRQRIAIARALILQPEIIVADEPVSALDISVQAQILNLMMDLQEEFGLTYLFISHDLSVVRHLAHDLMVMYLGRVVEYGSKDDIYSHPAHPYTKSLLASTPHTDPTQRSQRLLVKGELPSPFNPPSGCHFHTRCPYVQDKCSLEAPKTLKVDQQLSACHFAEDVIKQA